VTTLLGLARWASRLTLDDVPPRVRAAAIDQILSTVAAVHAGWDSDLGAPIAEAFPPTGGGARVIPTGAEARPSHAAMLMAAWSMVLDFDDVMLGGHTGHSSVLVPLAMARGRRGGELLLAQIVANELAARINMVCAAGSTRGQMATHLHLVSAAAARAKLEGLGEEGFANAMAFALSYPAQALHPAFLGSDAKTMAAAWPVRAGMESVDAVRAGLAANVSILDDKRGFFAERTRAPVRAFLGGLGQQWHTATNSFKLHPVCGYLCAAVDATLDLVQRHDLSPRDVAAVDVWSSLFTVGMDAHSAPYLDGPLSRIASLTFSTPFVIASAIHARRFGPAELKQPWIGRRELWELAARIRSRHDPELTRAALRADIPVGAALRRLSRVQAAGFGWSIAKAAFGKRWRHPIHTARLIASLVVSAGETAPLDLTKSTKPLGARVAIHLRDGRVLEQSVTIPRGFAGSGADTRALMREKFLACAATALGPRRAAEAAAAIETIETIDAGELAGLACMPAIAHVRSAR